MQAAQVYELGFFFFLIYYYILGLEQQCLGPHQIKWMNGDKELGLIKKVLFLG